MYSQISPIIRPSEPTMAKIMYVAQFLIYVGLCVQIANLCLQRNIKTYIYQVNLVLEIGLK